MTPLARGDRLRYRAAVRSLGLALVLVASAAATAGARPSNPAFLGIGMMDLNGQGSGPCVVNEVTRDSGAEAAGVRIGDFVLALDGKPVATCDALIQAIQARDPGDLVRLDVRRPGAPALVRIDAQLLSRDEVLRRRLVGKPVPSATVIQVEDGSRRELAPERPRRTTTVIGWFSSRCEPCGRVLRGVSRWTTARSSRSAPIELLGATSGNDRSPADALADLRLIQRTLDVPLIYVDPDTFKSLAIHETDRVHFMVIDSRGIVQYVAPIAPSSEDADAALDELYAAVEQAARHASR